MENMYYQFVNFNALKMHDKKAFVYLDNYGNDKTAYLNVEVRRRSVNEGWGVDVEYKRDYFEYLLEKEPQFWTETDKQSALAIMAAVKCFDMCTEDQKKKGYFETYCLGKEIPLSAVPMDEAADEGTVLPNSIPIGITKAMSLDTAEKVREALAFFSKNKNTSKFTNEKKNTIANAIFKASKKHDVEVGQEWKEKFVKKSYASMVEMVDQLRKSGMEEDEIKKVVKSKLKKQFIRKYVAQNLFDETISKSLNYNHANYDMKID